MYQFLKGITIVSFFASSITYLAESLPVVSNNCEPSPFGPRLFTFAKAVIFIDVAGQFKMLIIVSSSLFAPEYICVSDWVPAVYVNVPKSECCKPCWAPLELNWTVNGSFCVNVPERPKYIFDQTLSA